MLKGPLLVDARADLERVDVCVTSLINDQSIWNEFLRDPNGVFIRLGLHLRTSADVNARANNVFYATLTNRNFIRLVSDYYKNFRPGNTKQRQRYRKFFVDGLSKGVIQHRLEQDTAALNHAIKDPDFLSAAFRIVLTDLNRRGLLTRTFKTSELSTYIDSATDAIRRGRPLGEHPVLDTWDQNYGIGKPYGGLFAEVGAFVTGVGVAEVALWVTALGPDDDDDDDGPILAILSKEKLRNSRGASLRAAATLARLSNLSAELFLHASKMA